MPNGECDEMPVFSGSLRANGGIGAKWSRITLDPIGIKDKFGQHQSGCSFSTNKDRILSLLLPFRVWLQEH